METSSRRSYTKEQRAAAVADVPTLGVSEAAKKHGVPQTCVSRWAAAAGVRREVAPALASARESTTKATRGPKAGAPPGRKPKEQPADASKHEEPSAASEPKPSAAPTRRTLKTRVAKLYTPSQKALILEDAEKDGVTAASEKHGVSRFSIYGWQRRVAKAAQGEGPSPTTGPAPAEIEAQRDKEILDEWRRHPGLGPSQIRNQLRRKNVKVSVNTARRVMEEAGYRPPKVERKPHDQRFEATRPNHLWHLDFVQRNIHKANTFTLILIDDFSRYVVGHGVDEGAERADFVIAAFEAAVTRHGRPERVMHDKGAAFWSWKGVSRFTALLTELGIDQIEAEHKEWNGKVEVFNANLHKELFDAHRFYDLTEMRRRLATHLHWYNHARTHHSLGGLLVPADRYYGRVDEVLARIEAGAGRDVNDMIDLRERCLELFKVVSKGGVAEVWLLGKRLLELPNGAGP
jgi:transposase InsO family protein